MQAEVAVLGLGGMGSSAAYHLAKRGVQVIGFDRFTAPNTMGSSHGETRMIRLAYFEHPDYVPLLRSAYKLWDELAAEAGTKLFERCGITYIAPPTSEVAIGIQNSSKAYSIPLEQKSSAQGFRIPDGCGVWWEPDSGFLHVESCVQAHVEGARQAGAILHENTQVHHISFLEDSIELKTSVGTCSAKKLVITAGPWMPSLIPELPISVHRVVQHWFQGKPGLEYSCAFAYELNDGFYYGFPKIGGRFKIARHAPGQKVSDPGQASCEITTEDVREVQEFVSANLPGIDPIPVASSICFYSMSPDGHFIVDFHPKCDRVVFAGGFSGHGFKFASVIGEVLADLITTGKTAHPSAFLGTGRLKA